MDEIGNLPKDVQAMLLRVLQSRATDHWELQKIKVADVRIIAATNENLQGAVSGRAIQKRPVLSTSRSGY